MTGVQEWDVVEMTGTPGEIHAWQPEGFARRLNVCRPSSAALVLGSTQPESSLDRARAEVLGLPLVRRRSGGGAVLVRPGTVLWVTVDLPAGDPLWDDDLVRSFQWLGRTWAEALAACGVEDVEAYEGKAIRTEWSSTLCFAGLGSGEVRVGGRKTVGLSQRRTKQGATYHCAALLEWDPEEMAGLAAAAPDWLAEALGTFAGPCGVGGAALLSEFRQALSGR